MQPGKDGSEGGRDIAKVIELELSINSARKLTRSWAGDRGSSVKKAACLMISLNFVHKVEIY